MIVDNNGYPGVTPHISGMNYNDISLTITHNANYIISNLNPDTSLTLNSLTIESDGSLSHPQNYTPDEIHTLNLDITNDCTIDFGRINLDGKGYSGGTSEHPDGYGPGGGGASNYGGGAGHGGNGGGENSGSAYGNSLQPTELGSGGGYGTSISKNGTSGGGALKLYVGGTLTFHTGYITANGEDGNSSSGGSGSGGSIWINAQQITGPGYIWANGGDSVQYHGGGAGGRIAIYYASGDLFDLDIRADGRGYSGYEGENGTIHIEQL